MSNKNMSNTILPASEEQIAQIVELALRQRIPPVFTDLLLTRIHTLSVEEARSVADALGNLESIEQAYIDKGKAWMAFWKKLECRIEVRLAQELEKIEQEDFS